MRHKNVCEQCGVDIPSFDFIQYGWYLIKRIKLCAKCAQIRKGDLENAFRKKCEKYHDNRNEQKQMAE